jgi:dihydrolipoamide dehydrogenase
MSVSKFDIVVLGAGPGGYVGAIRAAQLGYKTALVEARHLGGICLNWGCIPTKALLRTAELYHSFQQAELYGLRATKVDFEIEKIFKHSRDVAKQLSRGVEQLLKKNSVTVIDGYGKLQGNGLLHVRREEEDVATLAAQSIIVATGSSPGFLPGLESDGKRIWSYKDALNPNSFPQSLIVIGSGAIGLEFASFYNVFGSKVTVVEILDQVLPAEDYEIAANVQTEMTAQGVTFHTGTRITESRSDKDSITLITEKDGRAVELTASTVLSAVGVNPNIENIGLEEAGVQLDSQGYIETDSFCRTSAQGVFAIGDVAGGPCLAHKASHEAMICVEKIAGLPDVQPLNRARIPACTYCSPQVASLGLTEQKALAAGYKIRVGRFPFKGNGKAVILGAAEGLVKTIFDEQTGELLGAHLVGPEVTELIQGFCIAQNLETTEKELMNTIFAHPTLSEAMYESVLSAYDRTLHY